MSCSKPMRSCAKPPRILRWRTSTAGPSHDRLHRRSAETVWRRADLPGAANRPVDVSRTCRARRDPERTSACAQPDKVLKVEVKSVFDANFGVLREGLAIALTVDRLMRKMGPKGVIRGRTVRANIGDKAVPCPLDHVNRQFHAPVLSRLWLRLWRLVRASCTWRL